jgi:hypothetical protein
MSSPVPSATTDLPTNGRSNPVLLSSNGTLFWRVFVPVFCTVFLTGLTVVFWVTDVDELYLPAPAWAIRALVTLVWVGWLLFVRRTLWRLKRVEADDSHVYVTNYWATVRYPWEDVERLEEKTRLGRRVVNMYLRAPGRFGSIISFLPGNHYNQWMREHGPAPATLVAETSRT